MASGTPVIGKVPNLKPEWMEESNGIWTYQFNEIIDILANYTQNWLEDNISPELYEKMLETAQKYQDTKKYEESIVSTFDGYFEVRAKLFSDQLDKLKISEEQN
jgi:glycosyltransferase involved in cell wall biosynthesis